MYNNIDCFINELVRIFSPVPNILSILENSNSENQHIIKLIQELRNSREFKNLPEQQNQANEELKRKAIQDTQEKARLHNGKYGPKTFF